MPTIAAFDFDKTLTRRDTFVPFLFRAAGAKRVLLAALRLLPEAIRVWRKRTTRDAYKEKIIYLTLRGMSATALQNIAQQYAEEIYDWMRPEAQSRALWHQTQGHTLAIVSASLDIYLASVANRLGFNELICSRLEIQNGTVTGKLIGHNCRGAEKVRRLTERFGDLKAFDLYAYGDSDGDKEMLAAAQHPFYRKFS